MLSSAVHAVQAAVATTMPMTAATIAPKIPFHPKCATIVHAAIPPMPPQTTIPRMLPRVEPYWEDLILKAQSLAERRSSTV